MPSSQVRALTVPMEQSHTLTPVHTHVSAAATACHTYNNPVHDSVHDSVHDPVYQQRRTRVPCIDFWCTLTSRCEPSSDSQSPPVCPSSPPRTSSMLTILVSVPACPALLGGAARLAANPYCCRLCSTTAMAHSDQVASLPALVRNSTSLEATYCTTRDARRVECMEKARADDQRDGWVSHFGSGRMLSRRDLKQTVSRICFESITSVIAGRQQSQGLKR